MRIRPLSPDLDDTTLLTAEEMKGFDHHTP